MDKDKLIELCAHASNDAVRALEIATDGQAKYGPWHELPAQTKDAWRHVVQGYLDGKVKPMHQGPTHLLIEAIVNAVMGDIAGQLGVERPQGRASDENTAEFPRVEPEK